MKTVRNALICLVMTLLLSGASSADAGAANLGTGQYIGGRTVLVAIFVNTPQYSWDFNDSDDLDAYSKLYYRLQTASEWLERQTSSWNVWSDFVWDWYNNSNLYYVANFDKPLNGPTSTRYSEVLDWFRANIDPDALLSQYDADNILFMWYVNSDLYQDEHCFAFQFDYTYLTDSQKGYEGVWFNVRHSGFTLGAPTLAHEILHCFGAVDLYYSNDQINSSYVSYLDSIGSSDIMHTIYDQPDVIDESFTELDAYYTGLTSYSYDVQSYGLGLSPHLR
ncbi:MAG: hypothetical protein K6C06_08580 [Lachnospiraceae bacterium]|nr:hypothetical protein [Lachnospiraceae bacterium]